MNNHNLILIGFMGSGKSRIGKELAIRLQWAFRDSDLEIQKKTGKSITDIFAHSGEATFRRLETDWCKQLINSKHCVVSTGGGMILSEQNRELLRQSGQIVWLKASVSTILDRIQHSRKRPLLNVKEPKKAAQTMLTDRLPLYEQVAHIELDTDGKEVDQIVDEIIQKAGLMS